MMIATDLKTIPSVVHYFQRNIMISERHNFSTALSSKDIDKLETNVPIHFCI